MQPAPSISRPGARALVHRQVVQHHDLSRHQGGQQQLFDVGLEALPRQGAIEHHRRAHARRGDAGQQGHALPALMRDAANGALPTRSPRPQPGQGRWRGRFIEKDEALGSNRGNGRPPCLAFGLVAFGGNQRLFLSGSPKRRTARDMVAILTVTPCVLAHNAQCSASVASGWACTCSRSAGSACAPMWRCRPGRRVEPHSRSHATLRQRRMVRSGTPKVRVASARPSPASRARSKRSRKSAEYCFIPAASHPDDSFATRSNGTLLNAFLTGDQGQADALR